MKKEVKKIDLSTYLEEIKRTGVIEKITVTLEDEMFIFNSNKTETKIELPKRDVCIRLTSSEVPKLEDLSLFKDLLASHRDNLFKDNVEINAALSQLETNFQFVPLGLLPIYKKAMKPLVSLVMFFKGVSKKEKINQNLTGILLGVILKIVSQNSLNLYPKEKNELIAILENIRYISERILAEAIKSTERDMKVLNGEMIG
ncbi:MAG: hypothetical protein ACM3UU_00445 [Ignavibacteriales bacterium]